jgi:hypothetical protein
MTNDDARTMTLTDSISRDRMPAANAQERAEALRWARLALMRELEESLHQSRKALLAQDLAAIERCTREQVDLIRELDALMQRSMASPVAGRQEKDEAPGRSPGALELEEELRRSRSRILEAVRLQAALLARARAKLRILANMLAGPSVTYGPWLARSGARSLALENRRRF